MRRSSSKNSGGGCMIGLPSERSKTFSSPNCCLRTMPSSNIRRIHEPCSMNCLIFFDTAMAVASRCLAGERMYQRGEEIASGK